MIALVEQATDERTILSSCIADRLPGYPGAELFHPSANIQFNPLPSATGKCSKLKINLIFDSTLFVAGGSIKGKLELISTSDTVLSLGQIAVNLSGFEGTQRNYNFQ